jgi:hypothetical protein
MPSTGDGQTDWFLHATPRLSLAARVAPKPEFQVTSVPAPPLGRRRAAVAGAHSLIVRNRFFAQHPVLRMNNKIILAAMLVLAVAALIFFIMMPAPDPLAANNLSEKKSVESASPRASSFDSPTVATDKSTTGSVAQSAAPVDIVSGSAELQDAEVVAIREKIIEGVVTYSEEGLPAIESYLSHPNPEVRAEAIDGMIQISVPAAAQMLRKAAGKTSNPEDKIKMLEAAEFIELPSIPPDLLKQKKSATNAP